MTDVNLPGEPLTRAHRSLLHGAGLTDEYLDRDDVLIRTVSSQTDLEMMPRKPFAYVTDFPDVKPSGLLFGWRDLKGEVRWQLRLDEHGELAKYLAERDYAPTYGVRADAGEGTPIIIVEGTKQSHSVACAVGDTHTVIAVPGCSGWSTGGWVVAPELRRLCTRREVHALLDADAAENRMVYDSGVWLANSLGPLAKTKFLRCPGGSTEGIDDYLGTLDEGDRADALEALIADARTKPADRRPDKKKASLSPEEVARRRAEISETACADLDLDDIEVDKNTGLPSIAGEPLDGSVWFDQLTGQFMPETLARYILGSATPVALVAGDEQLAVYGNGYYHADRLAFDAVAARYLGDRLTQTHVANVRLQALRLCQENDRRLPDRTPYKGYVNLRNGMLDVSTLTLHPHSPKYQSLRQLPVKWDPDATCPQYEEWLEDRVGAPQVGVIEEAVSQFLDEGRTPSKALFVFGPNRTGKSTLLRIAEQMVGGDTKVSGVSLQQLSGEGFGAAELFSKPLNICPDMPSSYIEDLSVFKRVTGDDTITASKKYGLMLTFRANALFLLSGNTLPTVAASEGASYLSRVVPAAFLKTYLGFENPNVEENLLQEIPGILVRWAKARQAHIARNFQWLPVHSGIAEHFAAESDRVARFLSSCCVVGIQTSSKDARAAATARATGTDGRPKFADRTYSGSVLDLSRTWPELPVPATASQLFEAATAWWTEDQGKGMNKRTFAQRLDQIAGVRTDCSDWNSKTVTNIGVKPSSEWAAADSNTELRGLLFPGWTPRTPNDDLDTESLVASVPANVTPINRSRRGRYWK